MMRHALAVTSLVALAALLLFAPAHRRVEAVPPADVPLKADAPKPDPKADAELVKTAQGLFKDLSTVTLENGLRVYLLAVKNAPIVTTMGAYRVGSAAGEEDQTGLTRYLEHLLFRGTAKRHQG